MVDIYTGGLFAPTTPNSPIATHTLRRYSVPVLGSSKKNPPAPSSSMNHISVQAEEGYLPATEDNMQLYFRVMPATRETKQERVLQYVESQRKLVAMEEQLRRETQAQARRLRPVVEVDSDVVQMCTLDVSGRACTAALIQPQRNMSGVRGASRGDTGGGSAMGVGFSSSSLLLPNASLNSVASPSQRKGGRVSRLLRMAAGYFLGTNGNGREKMGAREEHEIYTQVAGVNAKRNNSTGGFVSNLKRRLSFPLSAPPPSSARHQPVSSLNLQQPSQQQRQGSVRRYREPRRVASDTCVNQPTPSYSRRASSASWFGISTTRVGDDEADMLDGTEGEAGGGGLYRFFTRGFQKQDCEIFALRYPTMVRVPSAAPPSPPSTLPEEMEDEEQIDNAPKDTGDGAEFTSGEAIENKEDEVEDEEEEEVFFDGMDEADLCRKGKNEGMSSEVVLASSLSR
ncbi:uncharacterized protein VTP21DRAFT_7635 [Calcarisporiella thermophila]|uniref:uncharacterized protein n=1 Tax=Calcarisporiella thermophila TaxID=911321 RepID=UPI0037426186